MNPASSSPDRNETRRPALQETVTLQPDPGLRVLVADDHADSREVLAALLQVEGWKVKTAANGLEALKVGRRWRPTLVLMDIWMPILDGVNACLRMKSDPAFARTSFYAVTADETFAVGELRCFEGCLRKPIDFNRLAEILKACRQDES